MRYPLERLYEEVAYIAYHFHWSYGDIMAMEHAERQRWVEEVARINVRLSEAALSEAALDETPYAGPGKEA